MLSEHRINAYKETNYHFDDVLLKIDKESVKAQLLLEVFKPNGGLFITAWNPMGNPTDRESNELANRRLEQKLLDQGFNVIDGYGESPDGKWREDSFFVYPISEEKSIELCQSYLQNAVVYVTTDGLATLLFNPDLDDSK